MSEGEVGDQSLLRHLPVNVRGEAENGLHPAVLNPHVAPAVRGMPALLERLLGCKPCSERRDHVRFRAAVTDLGFRKMALQEALRVALQHPPDPVQLDDIKPDGDDHRTRASLAMPWSVAIRATCAWSRKRPCSITPGTAFTWRASSYRSRSGW